MPTFAHIPAADFSGDTPITLANSIISASLSPNLQNGITYRSIVLSVPSDPFTPTAPTARAAYLLAQNSSSYLSTHNWSGLGPFQAGRYAISVASHDNGSVNSVSLDGVVAQKQGTASTNGVSCVVQFFDVDLAGSGNGRLQIVLPGQTNRAQVNIWFVGNRRFQVAHPWSGVTATPSDNLTSISTQVDDAILMAYTSATATGTTPTSVTPTNLTARVLNDVMNQRQFGSFDSLASIAGTADYGLRFNQGFKGERGVFVLYR